MKPITAALCFTLLSLGSALSPLPLVPEDCNATDVQAGLALDEINKDRDEGYILSLYRVADAHSQPAGPGRIFYLTIDVVETTCSVLSGKSWKDCGIYPFHQTVFGQCKAVLYLNLPWRKVKLYSYNCTLSTVPPRLIGDVCPECLLLDQITPEYVQKAEELVEQYNKESNNTNYFILDKVERASMQWAYASYFVEFSIRETNCSRLVENTSDCEVLEDDKAHVGFCDGSSPTPMSGLFVSCEIYDPKPDPHHRHRGCGRRSHRHGHRHGHKHGPGHKHHHDHHPHGHNHTNSEDRNHQEERPAHSHGCKDGKRHSEPQGHGHRHGERHSEKHRSAHGKGHGKGHGQGHGRGRGPPNGGHKHHGSSSEEHSGSKPMPPSPAGPVGSVQLIYPENESDVFPVPTIPDPSPSAPIGSPAVPDPFKDPEPQPFPLVPSNSPGCPAEPKHTLAHISSLLPLPK
ncbi:fetuin-B-like [Lissotriton helveticus]